MGALRGSPDTYKEVFRRFFWSFGRFLIGIWDGSPPGAFRSIFRGVLVCFDTLLQLFGGFLPKFKKF